LVTRAILCPKSDDASKTKGDISQRLDGDVNAFYLIYVIDCESEQEILNFPM